MKNVLIFSICLFGWLSSPILIARAQQSSSIQAIVVDSDRKPVPFASVRLVRMNSGVITNVDGSFKIPANSLFMADTLAITCIGYKTLRVAMAQLNPGIVNTIRLSPSSVELPTVEIHASGVRRVSGKNIVAAAINQLSYNNPQEPFSYIAYYRDYQVKNGSYLNMNEAIVKVDDQGFQTNDQMNTKLELIEYRPNTSFPIDSYARQPYDNSVKKFIPNARLNNFYGNELVTLMVHDPIRNHAFKSFSFVYRLDQNFVPNHTFGIEGLITEGGRTLYVITFMAREYITGNEHKSAGKIYIEKDTYRIHKLEYSTWETEGARNTLLYQVTVEYTQHDESMFLNYISFNNRFSMRHPDDFKVNKIIQLKDTAAFIVKFSHVPTEQTALTLANYRVRLDGKGINLDSVRFVKKRFNDPSYRHSVILYVQDKVKFNKQVHYSLERSVTIDVTNVFDLAGREVNHRTFIDATQYREVFVQKLASPDDTTKYADIDKLKPLFELSPSTRGANTRFWMNTPLKKDL